MEWGHNLLEEQILLKYIPKCGGEKIPESINYDIAYLTFMKHMYLKNIWLSADLMKIGQILDAWTGQSTQSSCPRAAVLIKMGWASWALLSVTVSELAAIMIAATIAIVAVL